MPLGKETVVRCSSFCIRSCNFLRNEPATTVELLGRGSSTIESFMGVEGLLPSDDVQDEGATQTGEDSGSSRRPTNSCREM
jgi:hypothetical protein